MAFGTKVDSIADPDNVIVANARKIFNFDFKPMMALGFMFPRLQKLFDIEIFDKRVMTFFKELTMKIVDERKRDKVIFTISI